MALNHRHRRFEFVRPPSGRRLRRPGWCPWVCSALVLALIPGCSFDSSDQFVEVREPLVLPHEVWGRPDLRYSGRGARVAVLGDDIVRSAEGDLRRALAGYAVKLAAIRGEGFTGGERSSVDPSVEMVEIARAYSESDPARVVIALGFNDVRPTGPDHPTLMSAARTVFDQFGESCIVGLTIDVRSPLPGHKVVRARALNDLIKERSDRVVDWNAMVREQPDLLSDDGFTPSPTGADALVQAIRTNVEACI